eukprot:gnl/MRDRNA2_/MRDRNA2_63734_c0_seq2.p1 gnl/MRDRNA2_/MRDRNA2_63734_c0~~gnl/MRDRNA2_/MRDRNA2_63734_c0_seq2.p1  ORF type:complete len:544 (-),score=66.85 gnl/MRDRNA2_/MRDRNA2_63734_c0_seq2:77-1627(-)
MAHLLEFATPFKYYHSQIAAVKHESGSRLKVGEQVWVGGEPVVIYSAPLDGEVLVKAADEALIFVEESEVSRTAHCIGAKEDGWSNESDEENEHNEQHLGNLPLNATTAMGCPQVPLQPWEVDKLQSIAAQVVLAMEEGRYDRDYGAILLNNIGSWKGAEQWAQTESATLHSLVNADNAQSREEFRHWIENSLVCYLREVQKEVNRGRLAGMQDEPPCAASRQGSSSQAASSYMKTARDDDEEYDVQEAIALNEALVASRQDHAPSHSSSAGREGLANPHQLLGGSNTGSFSEFFACESSDNDESSGNEDLEFEDWGLELEEIMDDLDSEAGGAAANPCESKRVADSCSSGLARAETVIDTDSSECAHSSGLCNHSCDLMGSCCRCIARAPRLGLVPHLHAWWRQRGVQVPTPGAARWRFYCGTCATASQMGLRGENRRHGDSVLPLPFGGVLQHSPAFAYANEIVEAEHASMQSLKSQTGSALVEYDLTSEDGSWVAVEVPGLKRSASGTSWILP